ncbi:MAG: heme biosynthesis HemY N-terminal domain-containing protein [Pseudomonadota bacterium]|jgi:HemY protein|nr:hypothetical protein [Alphaproteobacteria bacterium]
MILTKSLRFLIAFSMLCILGIFITSYPGEVKFDWLNYSISLPIGLFIACLSIIFIFIISFYNLWRWLWSLPQNYISYLQKKRSAKGINLLIEGLSAIAAGQDQEAKEIIAVACEFLPENPLSQFIAAQASYMTGDEEAATRQYMSMQKDRRTNFLGLRGLILQAKSREDYKLAQEYIVKGLSLRPDSPWLQNEYFLNTIYLAQKGILPKAEKHKLEKYVPKAKWLRYQAMLHWLKLQNTSLLSNAEKEKLHLKIFESAPDWTTNVTQLVEHYIHHESFSKAQKLLIDAFKTNPHRSLGVLWDSVFFEMEAIDRYRTMEKLVSAHEDHPESLFCLATSAMRAQLWGQAKEYLDKLLSYGYTRTTCNLMAELMELQHPTRFELAKEWWQKASQTLSDYEWQCTECSHHASQWELICNNCSSVDKICWQETSTPQRHVKGDIEAMQLCQVV